MRTILCLLVTVIVGGCSVTYNGLVIPPCQSYSDSVLDVGKARSRYPCVGMCGLPPTMLDVNEKGELYTKITDPKLVEKRSVIIVDRNNDIQCQEITP